MTRATLVIAAAMAIGAVAATAAPETALPGNVTGPPRQCLQLSQVGPTRIVGNSIILLQVGSRWYRSTLPSVCPGLNSTSGISNNSTTGSICAGDLFTVFAPGQGPGFGTTMGSCNYGPFTPVDLPPSS